MENLMVSDVPHMLRMWDYELNTDCPENVHANSGKTRFWRCPVCGYSWTATPRKRFSKTMCPCHEINQVIKSGVNDVLTVVEGFSELLDEDNDFETIATQGVKSKMVVNFKCKDCGRRWKAQLYSQVKKKEDGSYSAVGCRHYHSLVGRLTVADVPHMKRMWDYERNTDYPENISAHDRAKRFWKCPDCGYSWITSPKTRYKGTGTCIHCKLLGDTQSDTSGNRPAAFDGKLAISDVPHMMRMWDFERNEESPKSISPRDKNKRFWRCPDCGYSWIGTPKTRYYSSGKCPCHETNSVIVSGINDVMTIVKGFSELLDKDNDFETIRFQGTSSTMTVNYCCKECGRKWSAMINSQVKKIGDKQYCAIGCQHENTISQGKNSSEGKKRDESVSPPQNSKKPRVKKGQTDVLSVCPEIATIYDFETNQRNGIDIYSLGPYSKIVAHFKCKKCGREWDSSIKSRLRKKDNSFVLIDCSQCSNKVHRKEPYSKQYPVLAKMYREDLNGIPLDSIQGADAVLRTRYKWTCLKCGTVFESVLGSMVKSYRHSTKGCPVCAQAKSLEIKSFAECHPELMIEYAPDNTYNPYEIATSSKEQASWICKECGCKWSASFALRHSGGGKCPICYKWVNNRMVNSFSAVYPDYAKYWSQKNSRSAEDVVYNSSEWWFFICPTCGGEYGSFIEEFISNEAHHCPYCDGTRVLPGYNSLKALYPEVALRWSSNNDTDPDNILPTLAYEKLWICNSCHGEYSAPIRDVVAGTDECPYCKGTRVLPGYNSLKALYPEVALRWSSNNDTDPDNILPTLTYEKLWICNSCHGEYSAPIRDVVAGTDECPYCKGRRVLPGYNSFTDKHPDLTEELDDVSNYLLPVAPNEVLDNSTTKFWWICKKDKLHKYLMSPKTRLMYEKRNREPCLYCRGQRRKLNRFVSQDSKTQE